MEGIHGAVVYFLLLAMLNSLSTVSPSMTERIEATPL